ncbi:MAG TPA: bifunctional precorrin-2 dehydrogenase/sirohydrochlorin ferrochelatase [Spirochaetota bacterium]|nr:bifunctional precorrin-2 dehydrogenase/sirohydrochlorin ferrochelatase [Spirochaetota bacterium]
MKYYPIFIDLKDRHVTVIGGGDVALRKVHDLIEAGAFVTVVSPQIHPELQRMSEERDNPIIIKRDYYPGDLEGAVLAFSATDSAEINAAVHREASERGIFINAVDDPEHCSFIIPSSFTRGDLTVAVSTGGASPAMAAKVRRVLERSLPDNIGRILEALKEARGLLREHDAFRGLDPQRRMDALKAIVASDRLLEEMSDHHRAGTLVDFLRNHS